MSFTPPMFGSAGGLPLGSNSYFWNLQIPTGFAGYDDGIVIRNRENSINVSARVTIPSVISTGTHYNVVGKIRGYVDPEKTVIISGHYDTVMDGGFCDNGAGTAGVLELAKTFTDAVQQGLFRPTYTLLFIAFTGEELGLAGSTNYIAQHKINMTNIKAVINLDCIGSDDFYVSQTDPVNGFDLDQVVLQAAADLGINAQTEPSQGDSDHAPFIDPAWANSMYFACWGIDAQITDAQPVQASACLFSYPLVYSAKWSLGTPGWIHTSWDNSTSTTTLNWVEIVDLVNHIKIAALATIRVSPNAPELPRNVAVTGITPYKNVVGQNYTTRINVIVQNQGGYAEYVNITIYANSTAISTLYNTQVPGSTLSTFTILWNASSFIMGTYVISMDVWLLPHETNTTDNTFISATQVHVGIPGDVSSVNSGVYDGTVNMRDIAYMILLFNTKSTSSNWNPNADVNDDDTVNMRDISIAIVDFNKHE